jgi:ferredoxin-NADP reductase
MNQTDGVPGDDPFISYSGTIGLIATVLFSINILLGLLLSTRYNPVHRWPHRRLPIFDIHNWTGYLALAVAFTHPALLLFQNAVTFSLVDVLLPIGSPQQPTINTIGAFAIYALLVVVVTSAFRTSIGLRTWKAIHYTSYAATPAFFIHGVFTNPNLDNQPADLTDGAKFLVYACIIIVASAIFWRVRHGIRRTAVRELAAATPAFMDQPTTWAGTLQVARIFQETPTVKTFRMVSTDRRRLPFTFKPGQFLTLSLPVDGKQVRRTYTVSSPPTRTSYVEITVKREVEGVASHYLHDQVREGDLIDVRALSGRFTFTGDESHGVVLIGGGVGITPMMSVLRNLTDAAWEHDVWMVFAVRTPHDIIYGKELTYLEERHPNFHLQIVVETVAGTDWRGSTGRVTAQLLSDFIPDLPGRRIYLCGPAPMMDAVRAMLEGLGVPPGQVLTELFSTPVDQIERDEAAALARGACAAQVEFRVTGKTVPVTATQTILDAAEAAGVKLDYSCRNGTCGTCRVRLVSGTVAMTHTDALLKGDVADHLILACQARATSSELLIDA